MSDKDKSATSSTTSRDGLAEGPRSTVETLQKSIAFEDDESETARATNRGSHISTSGIKTSTPGGSRPGSLDDLTTIRGPSKSALRGGVSSRSTGDPSTNSDHQDMSHSQITDSDVKSHNPQEPADIGESDFSQSSVRSLDRNSSQPVHSVGNESKASLPEYAQSGNSTTDNSTSFSGGLDIPTTSGNVIAVQKGTTSEASVPDVDTSKQDRLAPAHLDFNSHRPNSSIPNNLSEKTFTNDVSSVLIWKEDLQQSGDLSETLVAEPSSQQHSVNTSSSASNKSSINTVPTQPEALSVSQSQSIDDSVSTSGRSGVLDTASQVSEFRPDCGKDNNSEKSIDFTPMDQKDSDLYKMDQEVSEVQYPVEFISEQAAPAPSLKTSTNLEQGGSSESEEVMNENSEDSLPSLPSSSSIEDKTVFTVVTPTQDDATVSRAAATAVTPDSASSSAAELLQLLTSDDMVFDAEQFTSTSTPKSGRSVRLSHMKLGRGEHSQTNSYSELSPRGSNTVAPVQLPSSSIVAPASQDIERPSILRGRSSNVEAKASQDSLRRDSKVTFQDKVQKSYFIANSVEGAEETEERVWDNALEERGVSLDLPKLSNEPSAESERPESDTLMKPSPVCVSGPVENTVHHASLNMDNKPDPIGSNHVSPSKLFQKIYDREEADVCHLQRASVSSYTTPSELLARRMSQDDTDSTGVSSLSESSVQSLSNPVESITQLIESITTTPSLPSMESSEFVSLLRKLKVIEDKGAVVTVSQPAYASLSHLLERVSNQKGAGRCHSQMAEVLKLVRPSDMDGELREQEDIDITKNTLCANNVRERSARCFSLPPGSQQVPSQKKWRVQTQSTPHHVHLAFGKEKQDSVSVEDSHLLESSCYRHLKPTIGSEDGLASDEYSEGDDNLKVHSSHVTFSQRSFKTTSQKSDRDDRIKQPCHSITMKDLASPVSSQPCPPDGRKTPEGRSLSKNKSARVSTRLEDEPKLSPRSQLDAKTQNQMMVKQALVDMINAVTLYQQNMSSSAGDQEQEVQESKSSGEAPLKTNFDPIPSRSPVPMYHPLISPSPNTPRGLVVKAVQNGSVSLGETSFSRPPKVVDSYFGLFGDYDKAHSADINTGSVKADRPDHAPAQPNSPPTSANHDVSLPSYDKQRIGASLPTSRVASPDPDQILGTNRRKAASADVSKFLVEKEVLESQLRKLQVENSTLQTENKLLKEKYNRGQTRISQLESQVRQLKREALSANTELGDDLTALKRRTRELMDRDQHDLQGMVGDLTRQLEIEKSENDLLRRQLESSRLSLDTGKASLGRSHERSRIIDSFRIETLSLKEEIRKARQLLVESERCREEEALKRKEASAQVLKLTEMKALLQQQLEEAGGGSVAERQIKSIERRLKITEDRLHQERADRASKLSDVEEKLINENARLQVAEKELKRQLSREREKHRSIEQKFKDLRDENERLRVHLSETNSITDNMGLNKLRAGQKKHADELKHVLDQIKKEDNLGPGQEQDIIWLLWQRKTTLEKQLKEWALALEEVKVEYGNITHGLKVIRDERGMFEDRISRYKDTLEDVTKEKDELEGILKGKVRDLTQTHHSSHARIRNLEDMNAAIVAENDSLRTSLRMTSPMVSRPTQSHAAEAHLESLHAKVQSLEADLAQKSRAQQLADSELESARARLAAKNAALEESLEENERLLAGHLDGGDLIDVKQQQIDKLTSEIRGLQAEVKLWKDKLNTANTERSRLEEQVEQLTKSRSTSRFTQDAAPGLAESDKLALETELHEKDNQMLKLSIQYNECENNLQRTKRQLAVTQQHSEQLDAQLDQLQAQLRQKTRLLERMTSTENERMTQIKALKENLTTANRELNEKTAQARMKQIEHEQLEKKLKRLDNASPITGTSGATSGHVEVSHRLLEYERECARRDLDRANTAMNLIIRENAELLTRVRELRQDLVKERAQLCHAASERVDLEQRLHLCREERDSLQTERDKIKSDISKISAETQRAISQLESEAHVVRVDYQSNYAFLDEQGKKMAVELGTVHRLLEAREKESVILRDAIEHQKDEIQSLNRKIDLLREENLNSRDDVERLTNELTTKMKENTAILDTSNSLAAEKTRLQMERLQLEKDLGQGGGEMERRLAEIQDLTRKLDKAEERFRDAERQLHQKETALVALETEVKHLNRASSALESERSQMRLQAEKAAEEVRSLRQINATLEQRLTQEKSSISEEKTGREQVTQELTATLRQTEGLRRDYEQAAASLETERRNVHNLQVTLQKEEEKVLNLEDRTKGLQLELDTLKSHLAENRNTIDQYKKDKQTLYQDVQELCRKLADKDETITRLQEKCSDAVDHLQKDFITEKAYMTKERERLELDMAKTKEEVGDLTQQLKHKDLQLAAYVHTNQELEAERAARQEVESRALRLEAELAEFRRELSGLQMDSSRKADQTAHTQESLEKAQQQIVQLKEASKTQREHLTRETHDLRQELTEQIHRTELERNDLQDQLNKALSDLRASEVTLASLSETKGSLYESTRGLERSLESLRAQLHEEITGRKLAEQKVESLKSQLEELRTKRSGLDDRNMELQARLAKTEAECNVEKEKYRLLKQEICDERSTSSNAEAHAQALHTQVTELQVEVSSLRSQLESQRQSLQGKIKKLTLDIKQQIALALIKERETFDKERSKLVQQSQQLSVDLETAREQVASKNRENLKLQEEILSVEERYREGTVKLKHCQEALKMEEEHHQMAELRAQELELKVRARSDLDSESSRLEATRAEVSKMMSDMQRKIKEQVEQNKNQDKDAAERQLKQVEEYKKKIANLESTLNQEQAMHMVTKTQLSSLDEDNHRLRQQLQAARKRASPPSDERSKSRMEEINKIIARSQTRAAQMMASGVYAADDTLRSSGRDLLSPIPMLAPHVHLNTSGLSDGNRSVASDDAISRDLFSRDRSGSPL